MGYECFDVEVADKVGHIRMNRPEKSNSMIPAFWRELPEIVDGFSASGSVRAIVLSSEGRHFCSGMDLEVFANDESIGPQADSGHRSRRNERFRSTAMKLQDTFTALERSRVPVLCAIQGACVGGGIDLVSAADMRYADESAFFSIAEINIGMTADVGTFPRLVKLIPEGVVRELAYTGRRIYADEARSVGLVNRVFPDQETMLSEVMKIAAEIARKPPMAVYGCKKMITYSRDHTTADTLDYIAAWNAAMLLPSEMQEAMKANGEKRPGEFVDLPAKRAR